MYKRQNSNKLVDFTYMGKKMKKIKIYVNKGDGKIGFSRQFLYLVSTQRKELSHLIRDIPPRDLKGVRKLYKLRLKVEHRRRAYLKMMTKEFQRDMYYYNNARSENNKLAMLNSLKNRNEAFNYYYRRIRLGVLGWEKK